MDEAVYILNQIMKNKSYLSHFVLTVKGSCHISSTLARFVGQSISGLPVGVRLQQKLNEVIIV
jgi:hypothetical protein